MLIATGIVFCGGFAVWSFWRSAHEGGEATMALGVVFAVLAAVLGYYLRHLNRFLGR